MGTIAVSPVVGWHGSGILGPGLQPLSSFTIVGLSGSLMIVGLPEMSSS
jgi:hypothetical protein